MKVAIYAHRDEHRLPLGMALAVGLRFHGDEPDFRSLTSVMPNTRLAIFVNAYPTGGVATLIKGGTSFAYIDLGYEGRRFPDRWRVSINSHKPTRYLARIDQPSDRRELFDWKVPRLHWRIPNKDAHILIAAGSDRLHALSGIAPPQQWVEDTEKLVRASSTYTGRPIIHRLKGKQGPAKRVLHNCHVAVTHGSLIDFRAQARGVPTIVLGDGLALNISSKSLEHLEYPYLAHMGQREAWLNDLAYTQWTEEEFRNGRAWEFIRALLLSPDFNAPTGDTHE